MISPLLSNVYLTVLDNALEERGHRFVRYADDVVSMCRSKADAEAALGDAREILAKLKLELNEGKTGVSTFREGFDYLGYHFGLRGRTVSTGSIRAFYAKVREATRRQQGDISIEQVIENLNPALRGWGNYHLEGRNVGLFTALDRWIRNRLRAYVTRRWITHHRRYKVYEAVELYRIGLVSLRRMIKPGRLQLQLF